jgi:hypothetical protein
MTDSPSLPLTHAQLVQRAVAWLLNSRKCCWVAKNQGAEREICDALGFIWNGPSILVECKASRADFLRDAKKPCRQDDLLTLGNLRFYLAPPGLISPEEIPERWGLLECHPALIRVIRDADKHRTFQTPPEADRRILLRNLAFAWQFKDRAFGAPLPEWRLERLDKRE